VPIVQEAGWAPGPVWTGAVNLASTGIRSPDRPARSQSLYRLSYPVQQLCNKMDIKINYETIVADTFENTHCSARVINLSTLLRFHASISVGAYPLHSQWQCRGMLLQHEFTETKSNAIVLHLDLQSLLRLSPLVWHN
jgi:hypothetical protein